MTAKALRVAAAAAPRPVAAPVLGPRLFGLVLAGVMLRMNLSANMLAAAGIPYAQDGGNPLIKIHAGTWLILLALLADATRAAMSGQNWLRGRPAVPPLFMAMIALCILHSLLSTGLSGVAVYVDSYLCAGAVAALGQGADARQRRVLGYAVLAALLANTGIALGEIAAHANLVPDMSEDFVHLQQADREFRALALDHDPLNGAMATMTGVFLALAMTRHAGARAFLVATLMLGLLAFGGRAALAVTVTTLLALGTGALIRRAALRRLGLRTVVPILATVVFAALAAWLVLAGTPLGERILMHLSVDDSAAARAVQWRALGLLDQRQWLLGSSIEQVRQIEFTLGLDAPFADIEDFWLAGFVSLGAVGFAFFLTGMVPFLVWLWRSAPFWGRCMLACGMVVASASNTLARKSDLLVLLVACVLASAGFAAERAMARPVQRSTPARLPFGRPVTHTGVAL